MISGMMSYVEMPRSGAIKALGVCKRDNVHIFFRPVASREDWTKIDEICWKGDRGHSTDPVDGHFGVHGIPTESLNQEEKLRLLQDLYRGGQIDDAEFELALGALKIEETPLQKTHRITEELLQDSVKILYRLERPEDIRSIHDQLQKLPQYTRT